MLENHPPAGAVESLEDAGDEEMEVEIEDIGAGEEHGHGHDASRKVVYPHAVGLCRRADTVAEE